jgi:hypothetical protein
MAIDIRIPGLEIVRGETTLGGGGVMAKLTDAQRLERRYVRARRTLDKLTARHEALRAEFAAIATAANAP